MQDDLPSNQDYPLTGNLLPQPSAIRKITGVIILAAILGLLTLGLEWGVTSRTPFGIDFFVYWLNARLVFVEGDSPYTPEAARQAQLGLYGRPAQADEDPKGFVYPPYSLFALWPTIGMAYPRAYAFWLAGNFLLLMLALRFSFPKVPLLITAFLPFFYPIARGLVMGQFAVLIGILFLIVYGLLKRDTGQKPTTQIMIGALLAWLTIKPQLTWLFILFFVIHFIRSKGWPALGSLLISLGILAGLSWLLVPGWPGQLWYQLVNGSDELQLWQPLAYVYAGWLSPSGWEAAFGPILWLVGFAAIFVVVIAWWRGKLTDTLTLAWFAFLTQFLHPLNMPPEQILFLLPLLIWTAPLDQPQRKRPSTRLMIIVWSLVFIVPYLTLFATFDIVESTLVTATLPLFFLIWIGWLSLSNHNQPTTSSPA